MSPPSRRTQSVAPKAQSTTHKDLSQAAVQTEDGFSWGKVAAGAGLAASALMGITGAASAAEVVAAEQVVESPEVVVMSESIQRIDLERRTEQDCNTDSSGSTVCEDVEVAYHPVGVHAGQGVVRDLNGNLFVAPQIVSDHAPGVAVVNPDRVDVRGPFGSRGRLERESDGDYETSGSLFGRYTLDVDRDGIEVGEKGLFGSSWQVEVTKRGNSVRINERYGQDRTLDADGDLSNSGFFGGSTVEIRHTEGQTTVEYPGWFAGSTTVTYSDSELERRDNGWLTSRVVEDGNEYRVKDGSIFGTTLSRTEKTKQGWTDKSGAFWGTSYRYTLEGGETVPGK